MRQYKGIKGIGKTVARQANGCSWCKDGTLPAYTTESIGMMGGRILVRWIGEGICLACVAKMKAELRCPQWANERRVFFDKKQFCADCETRGNFVPATILDHISPWRYRPDLFWSVDNWQGLCFDCHDAKSVLERS
jgi:hypothetical protein